MQPCIDARLAELDQLFQRNDAGQPLGLIGPIGRPSIFTAGKSALQIATADQSLAHMPLARKQRYFAASSAYDTFVPVANEERASWRTLRALDHAATLAPEDWRTLRAAYDAVVDNNTAMKANLVARTAGQWLTPFAGFPQPDTVEIDREVHSLPYVQALCRHSRGTVQ